MAYPKLGYEVLTQALDILKEKAGVEKDPKFEGRKLSMIITKTKVIKENPIPTAPDAKKEQIV